MVQNPDLCPNHQCEMYIIIIEPWSIVSRICPKCKIEASKRIEAMKVRALKTYRIGILAKWPSKAGLFEGL